MEQVLYKIGEVSTRLNLVDKNSNTLRGWAEEFGEFLSASAHAAPGQPRRFTERDVQVLTAVRDYRANHYSYDEIRERLRAGEHDVTPPRPEEPESPSPSLSQSRAHDVPYGTSANASASTQALVPMAQVERLLAPLTASVEEWRRLAEEYRRRLEARETRIEELEQRIGELYTRLDVRATNPTEAAGTGAPVLVPTAPIMPAAPSEVAGATAAQAPVHTTNGVAHIAQPDTTMTTAPIFPLPTVPRDAVEPAAPVEMPRRPWWRVWR